MAAESSDLLKDLFETLDVLFWEADPETLQFISVGPKAEALFGYPPSMWTSIPTFWGDITHRDDRQQAFDTRMQAVQRCETHRVDYRVIAADGRTRWVRDIALVKCEDERPTLLYGLMFDVTASYEQQLSDPTYRASPETHGDRLALLDESQRAYASSNVVAYAR